MIKRIKKYIKEYFCKHMWKCKYIYGTFADWECTKCSKHKKGFAPFGFTNNDIKDGII